MSAEQQALGRSISILLLAAVLWGSACAPPPVRQEEASDSPAEAPELAGTSFDGEPFRLSEQRGKAAVVFFGYTFCPDVCPFTLWKMKQLYARLEAVRPHLSDEVAVVFVSVDPKRDTLEKLAEYVPAFDRRFFGVRLEDEELETAIEDWELTVRHVPFQNAANLDGSYNVDHTGTYFLLDKEGRTRRRLPPKASVDEILPEVLALLEEDPPSAP